MSNFIMVCIRTSLVPICFHNLLLLLGLYKPLQISGIALLTN
jgi:hypothetical protein